MYFPLDVLVSIELGLSAVLIVTQFEVGFHQPQLTAHSPEHGTHQVHDGLVLVAISRGELGWPSAQRQDRIQRAHPPAE